MHFRHFSREKKWFLLMSLFRAKDTYNRQHLSIDTLRAVLDRADVGMSTRSNKIESQLANTLSK